MTRPFNPAYGSNQKITLAAASAEQHFRINKDNESLRVMNTGAAELYFKTYASGSNAAAIPAPTAVASAVDCRVSAGQEKVFSFDYNHDGISLVSATGTTVEFMTGTGGI